jgi:hypothetical protein
MAEICFISVENAQFPTDFGQISSSLTEMQLMADFMCADPGGVWPVWKIYSSFWQKYHQNGGRMTVFVRISVILTE